MATIKLGRKCGGSMPCAPEKIDEDAVHYPSLYIDSESKLDIPDEGTMTIKFKKVGSSTNKPRDGKESHSCTIDVMEITNVKGNSSKSKEEDSGDALDRARKEVEEEKGEDEGEGY